MNFIEFVKTPRLIIFKIGIKGWIKFLDDKTYLKLMYWAKFGKKLNLDAPVTFNEKIQWLKLHNKKSQYTQMVDKFEAKKYALRILNEDICVPTIAVFDSVDKIDKTKLPEKYVMKCTHDSHSVYVCNDSTHFDFEKAKKNIAKGLRRNYYWTGREYPYKNVKPRIIIEEYLEDSCQPHLLDYKFYIFNGKFKLLSITERKSKHEVYIDFYDSEFNKVHMTWGYPGSGELRHKPVQYEKMITIAETLAKDIPILRVDFYEVQGRAYLGEMTFFDGSGFDEIDPKEWDIQLGSWIKTNGLK